MQHIKNFLRNHGNFACLWHKQFLQKKKKLHINLHGNWFKYKLPFIENFQYTPKSDTIFILGSGASVNELSNAQWQFIKNHDSVGLNNWLIHDFVPDFYMFCGPASEKESDLLLIQDFFHNINIKKTSYENIKMIFKMNTDTSLMPFRFVDQIPENLRKNFYFSPVLFLSFHDNKTLQKALVTSFRHLEKKKSLVHLHAAASVFDLIAFAVKLNFKKIVLIGIDLTTDYFFETDYFKNLAQNTGLKLPAIERYNQVWHQYKEGNVHGTEIPSIIGGLPISVILDELDKVILTKKNIQLFVSSKTSKLHPRFPCYFPQNS